MLSCRELVSRADDLLDGTTTLPQRFRLRLHLAMCHHCRRYLKQLKLIRAWLGRYTQQSDAADVATTLDLVRKRIDRG